MGIKLKKKKNNQRETRYKKFQSKEKSKKSIEDKGLGREKEKKYFEASE